MKIFIVCLFVLVVAIGCSNNILANNIVPMLVNSIDGNEYTLEYDGNLYLFIGCPLLPLPNAGDAVLIDIVNMQWVVDSN